MKEKKTFKKCPECGNDVRDYNLETHLASVHGTLTAFGKATPINAENPSEENRKALSNICYSRARQLMDAERVKDAKKEFFKALEYDSRNLDAYDSLSELLERHGHNHEELEKVLEKALEIEPTRLKFALRMACHQLSHSQLEAAIQTLRTANAYEEPAVLEKLATKLILAGRYSEARNLLEKVLPKMKEEITPNTTDELRDQFVQAGQLLYTLFTEPMQETTKIRQKRSFTVTIPNCSKCHAPLEFENIEKNVFTQVLFQCQACQKKIKITDENALYFPPYDDADQKEDLLINSLEVVSIDSNALLDIGYSCNGEKLLTGFAYSGSDSSETIEQIRHHLNRVTRLRPFINEGQIAIFSDQTLQEQPDVQRLSNSAPQIEKIKLFLDGVKSDLSNYSNYSDLEKQMASSKKLDVLNWNKNAITQDPIERIGTLRLRAMECRVQGLFERAKDYQEQETKITRLLGEQKTGYESTPLDELLTSLKQYEGEKALTPPQRLLLEITKRKDVSTPLMNLIQDPQSWDVGIWRAAFNAMYLLGAVKDERIIPKLVRAVSELEEKDYLGDAVTEELSCILANFGPKSVPALIDELNQPQHNEWVRLAVNNALFTIALLHLECRTSVVEALKTVVSNDSSQIVVSGSVIGLCVLQEKNAVPLIEKAYADGRVDEMTIRQDDLATEMQDPDLYLFYSERRHPLELIGTWSIPEIEYA